MDDAKKIIDEAEREGLQMSQGLLKLVLKMWESAREDVQAATAAARRLRLVAVLAAVLSAVCLCVCIYQGTVIHRQGGEIAVIHRILEEGVVIEETTTTTETTTTQRSWTAPSTTPRKQPSTRAWTTGWPPCTPL